MCYLKKLLSAILTIVLVTNASACPEQCTCKWKNGKQTVECVNKQLNTIPNGIDAGTQVLDVSGNTLRKLQDETFKKLELINLQRIYLSNCRITYVSNTTFKGLTNLIELDLSNNLLESIPSRTFLDIPNLMRLILSNNPIKKLKKGSFNHLTFLNTLELNNCEISKIEENAFQSLTSLEWLQLNNNKLTTLKGSKVLPSTLKGIELQGNLWDCDCHMVPFYQWLVDFNLPNQNQPFCQSPIKFKGKPIRSINKNELACLPEVSPTTFYLKIAEGNNISMFCHVHAIPEANVTWSFQGQVLQNDTLIAPGMRLYYFLEEGHEDKKSELLIYNVNSDDNGTYYCNAENPAGIVHSNYTIRIIVKNETQEIHVVTFPFEYLLAGVVAAGSLVLILIITIIVLICKCRRYRKRQQKRDKTKEVALQYQQDVTKCSLMQDGLQPSPDPLKSTFDMEHHQSIMFYAAARSSEDLLRTMSPVGLSSQIHSPASLRRMQLEQNPDLINDTEKERRKEGDGDECVDQDIMGNQEHAPLMQLVHPSFVALHPSCVRPVRKLQSMNSWDPGYSVDREGYPVDYGLPRMHSIQGNENFYRTLPYNRANKRNNAANPQARYSREAEFLSRSAMPESFEHYCPDIRYTADGYPARTQEEAVAILPSPPEGYKSDSPAPSSLPCCSTPPVQWPGCVPANMHVAKDTPAPQAHQSASKNLSRKSASAQTDSECSSSPPPSEVSTKQAAKPNNTNNTQESFTESPDEGYEGEANS